MKARRSGGPVFRFTFEHGIIADDRVCARVVHMGNCFPPELAERFGVSLDFCMSREEYAALDGRAAEQVGEGRFRVGRAIVTVQDGLDRRPNRRTGPYGVAVAWQPLRRAA